MQYAKEGDMPMPRDLIKDLELISKATPPPWNSHDKAHYAEIHNGDTWGKALSPIALVGYAEEDATFIAAAREGWPHAIERAIKAEAEVERLKLMVKSITGGLDEAIETNQYLGKQLDKAIEDIEILCTKHYELADDYDKLSDICQDFCLHTEGKCFKAAADNPNRCAKFRWRG
jgi:hypothetical protein